MTSLKYLLGLTLLLAVARIEGSLRYSDWGPRIQLLAQPLHWKCAFRTGASQYSINNVINGIFVDEPVIKAYAACLFKESGVISETGNFNSIASTYLFPDDIRDESISNIKYCVEVTNERGISKVEDRLYEILKCHYSLDPDIFIFF